jgi:uncharacterized protein YoxC
MSVLTSLTWSSWLLQATTQFPDTIVTKQVAVRAWWQTLIDIEQAIVPLALIALLAAIAFGVYKLGQGLQEVSRLVKASTGDLSGAAHSVRNVAEDIRGITGAVRGDVEGLSDTVKTVNERVRAAVSVAEERVQRFDALIDVAQEEVEDFVVSAASTLRGVRTGANVLRRSFWFARRGGVSRSRRRKWRERAARERELERDEERRAELEEALEARARERETPKSERPRVRTRVPDET